MIVPDRILLQGMEFYSHVGVMPFEKKTGQPFLIDIILECDHIKACRTDILSDTISYADAYELIRQVVEPARYDLIEKLAGHISEMLMISFDSLVAVDVTVRKPHAPIAGHFTAMGVRIRRERGDQA